MLRHRILRNLSVLTLLVPTCAFTQHESKRMKDRRALVQMEVDFAKAAAEKGTRAAFLEFLADDGVLFQPAAVNGKKYWTAREPRKGLLSWSPVFADVSRAGDLGYTTGPWEFRPNGPDDKPVAFGQYFTIWKKQRDGTWKVALDRGVSTEVAYPSKTLGFGSDNGLGSGVQMNVNESRKELLKLEEKFSNSANKKGTVAAFKSYLDDEARVLRQNMAPADNKQKALTILSAKSDRLHWQAAMADVSKSGDLGYTYGTFESVNGSTSEHGSYVRVWKIRSGKWLVVMDVMSADPK